ncbi:BcsR/BcsP family cellulose biosynthesis protein [Pseudoalteromonas sp. SSMSWG5]|jgi:hypothetical protein|uniref:BcsR/BcsP family cellulose biosynthesis protein n=1 Tax=Pseudoalteromonas TaxID=53246 RepID=UPI000C385971|nr:MULTISPECIES: BcsR/BcsP family cellulose biosynthesis protein [unclassified Pseudoalteromonas]MBD58272.1 hypothetical protein [Pseudoalteromonas sp.]MBU77187.1 hypothetical protein [Pseudoalteromonadaceae bacterium]MCF2899849.1 hypothetical protein [Pseudoalteromonas sp. OFAV1]MCF2921636.1 hypothetical protein [Pseudoalteromonas sp. APAL1]MCO7249861.1 hypothetical protein [Pseudoalteromonas sp. Ps84H-4]|tara:strand:- start:4883 stop:5086 length:204 start_codon:yes stop_codon:yes gene_type:complete
MNNFAVTKSNTLTQYDIDNLLQKFGGRQQEYVEITDVEKNRKTIEKYPLISDISNAIADAQYTRIIK